MTTKKKVGISLLALLCAGVVTASAVGISEHIKNSNSSAYTSIAAETNNVVINTTDNNGISLTAVTLSNELTANASYESSYSITATLDNEYAIDKTITWSLSCDSGDDPSDYVFLSSSSSESGEAITVYCTTAFSNQITLTATNGSISNKCTIDYVARITGVTAVYDNYAIYDDFKGQTDWYSDTICSTNSTTIWYAIFVYLIVVLLIAAVIGAVVVAIYADYTAVVGIYIEYDGEEYTEDNSGISVEYDTETYAMEFTICSSDWGAYNAAACMAKIVPNVTDKANFEYHIGEDNYRYGNIADLTAAFVEGDYDGKGFDIAEDGTFSIYFDTKFTAGTDTMSEVLSCIYDGDTVVIDGDIDINSYPYFAVAVTSPDGSNTITIPVTVKCSAYRSYAINYSLTNCYADSSAPVSLTANDEVTVTIYADDGYEFPATWSISGCTFSTSVNGSRDTATITLSECTGDITIKITCTATAESGDYSISGTWRFDEDCSAYAYLYINDPTINVNFTSNGTEYTYMSVTAYTIYYGGDGYAVKVYDFINNGGWIDENYRYVVFGDSEQYISESSYGYITHFAELQYDYSITVVYVGLDYVTEDYYYYRVSGEARDSADEGEEVKLIYVMMLMEGEIPDGINGLSVTIQAIRTDTYATIATAGGDYIYSYSGTSGSGYTLLFDMPAADIVITIYVEQEVADV